MELLTMCTAQPAYCATRKSLLISCATLAVVAAGLIPQQARAQAFQGSINSTSGTVTRANTSATSETITIGSPTATINWTPSGRANANGNINFLPAGNIATFQGTTSAGDFTVLNRIIPSGAFPIELNGTVQSFIGNNATGGNIWFYSPNGILIGASAVFNVGGLLLTTADPGSNWSTSANGFTAAMGPASSSSFVSVSKGAQINAQNSYVAIVAPKITQAGTVNVNGSAAYVAAEQATMTFNQGLFDITVDVGTDDPNGIVHTGSTTGSGNSTAADSHSIYMVAVPKNQALTMLLGGNVGFSDVQGATVQNGQIILSAGWNVANSGNPCCSFGQVSTTPASIRIGPGDFTSPVTAIASTDISAVADTANLTFTGNIFFDTPNSVTLGADNGNQLLVNGSVWLLANAGFDGTGDLAQIYATNGGSVHITGNASLNAGGFSGLNGSDGHAGTASISANGGSITIDGPTSMDASTIAFSAQTNNPGASGYGGVANITAANGGQVNLHDVDLAADGAGQDSGGGNLLAAGTGRGGQVGILSETGGTIAIAGSLSAHADGHGGAANLPNYTGGVGSGGIAELRSDGGSISVAGNVNISANGTGGNSVATGGEGDGGNAFMTMNGGSISVGGLLGLEANGQGGSGAPGGAGFGGWAYASIDSAGGTLKLPGGLRLQSNGIGGSGIANPNGIGGDGGEGFGGSATFSATTTLQAGASLNMQLTNVGLIATGTGGSGGDGTSGGAGGQANGGEAFAELGSANLAASGFNLDVTGHGGAGGAASSGTGGAGGDAFGGFIGIFTQGNVTGNVHADASTFGGAGGAGSTLGDGGNAEGSGLAFLDVATGGSLTGNVDLLTAGVGGKGANGGEGIGGTSEMFVEGSLNAPEVTLSASGSGGTGLTANGGFSQGGSANLFIDNGGSVNVTNNLFVGAVGNPDLNGDGSTSDAAGAVNGGDSQGGDASIEIGFGGGSLSVGGATTITARAAGGAGGANDGITGGHGGSGRGGEASFFATSSSCASTCGTGTSPALTNVAIHDLTLNATGLGGRGGSAATGGTGGEGDGGFTEMETAGASFTAGNITALARGVGGFGGAGSSGVGGAGGFGEGGENFFFVGTTGSMNASTYLAFANAIGGDGGNGASGLGDGGSAQSGFNDGFIEGTAAFGGSNDSGTGFVMTAFAQGGSGQAAGSATAGDTFISIDGSLTAAGHVQASASALHGNGSGGTAQAGSASIDVSGTLDAASLAVVANAFDASLGADPKGFGGTADLGLESGAVTRLGDVAVSALGGGGDVLVTGHLTASGAVDFESGGDIGFANVTAGKLNFDAGGAIAGGDINVADHLGGEAQGAITLGNITAGPKPPTSDDGFSVGISSATSIEVGNVNASGAVGFATLGDLTTGNVTSGNLFLALVGTNASFGSIASAPDGRVYVGNASMFTAAGGPDNFDANALLALAPVATGGSIKFNGAVTTGALQAAAGTGLTLGNVTAGSSVDVSAGGLADFEGKIAAPKITVTSSDINIASGASLGVFGVTNLLTLNAISNQPIVIGHGGTPAAGQYVLDEAGDIQSANLIINALGSGGGAAPDVDIFGVNIDGSQTSGGGFGSVAVHTGGSIVVGGAVKFANAGASDSLTLKAGKNIEVITDTGSIAMTNNSGALSGALTLSGDNIWIASQSIISALETDAASVTPQQLAANSGTANPAGFVSAGGVTADIGTSFLVQNSGTADDLGGITIGDGGLTISTLAGTASVPAAAATPPAFTIYGRQVKADNTAVTGKDFVPLVKVSGTFASTSTINGCPITGCAPPPPPAPALQTLASDQVLGPIGASDSTIAGEDQQQADQDKKKGKSDDDTVETWTGLINLGPINLDRPIDEPVTSGSDVDINFVRVPDGCI